MRSVCVIVVAALAITGCSSPDRSRLDRGMKFARKTIEQANADPATAAALKDSLDRGETIADYVEKLQPDDVDLPPFSEETPTLPWAIRIKMTDQWHVSIEGYGEDLDKPLSVMTVRLSEMRR